jgi:O-antigen/teichoic acid export membrane protein
MLRKIIGTAGSRIIIALITFAIVVINARALGTEGVGEIALIVLGITIILLISNLGSGGLVYLIPRYDPFKLIVPSYAWAFLSSVIGAFILSFFKLIPDEYTSHVLFLSLFQALGAINLTFLIGKEKIKQYNLISVLQFIMVIATLSVLVYIMQRVEVMSYVYALYVAYILTFIVSFMAIRKFIKVTNFSKFDEVLIQVFKYGSYVQLANLLQLMNYRLGYYIIEKYLGKASLGIFDVGNKVSEGLWLIGKSVALVQYSKISNNKDAGFARDLTIRFLKFVFVITFLMLVVLLLLPDSFFMFVFGDDFTGLSKVVQSLATGILSMSVSMILSHFFSGTGRHYHNTISSGIGLALTLIFGFTLIPEMGIIGAGITASISYFSSMLYQMIVFVRISGTGLSQFMIKKEDIKFVKDELRELIGVYAKSKQ